ncbi:MAG TPA: hypothetical protein VMW35_05430 [Myxococcota bacterium]|nr:hypothetical protein [Myxococcota bacterium]
MRRSHSSFAIALAWGGAATAILFVSASTSATAASVPEERALFITSRTISGNESIGRVGKYTTSGATVDASLISGLSNPFGVTVSDSTIFVADSNAGTIGKYTTSGQTVNASLISGFNNAWGVAVSGSTLFVASQNAPTSIGTYTTSGRPLNPSLINTNLYLAESFAVSGSRIFVGAGSGIPGDGRVFEYTTSGQLVNDHLITNLTDPYGLAVSGSDLFVADLSTGIVGKYTTSGATVDASLITMTHPAAIAVSGPDLFISDLHDGTDPTDDTVGRYTTSGEVVNASLINGVGGFGLAIVPEPATGLLVALGVGGLVAASRARA